jgi:hypothetical protein
MSDSYQGPVRVYGSDGILLTTGKASLESAPDMGSWRGAIQTLRGTAVSGKALVVYIETPDGKRGLAQLTPMGEIGEYATSGVAGLSPGPF